MNNERKLTKSQTKNLELLTNVGSVDYVTNLTLKAVGTSVGIIKVYRGSIEKAQTKGFNLRALSNLEKKGLVSSSTSTTYHNGYCPELDRKSPTGSSYRTVVTFSIK